MYRKPETRSVTIGVGETTSPIIDIRDYVVVGVVTPGALTSTTLKFEASPTRDGVFVPVYADDTEVSLTVGADRMVGVTGESADALSACQFLRLVVDTAEGGDRLFVLLLK